MGITKKDVEYIAHLSRLEITEEEKVKLDNFIASKINEGIYILRIGEIEDYLPGVNSTGRLIEFLENPNWLLNLKEEARSELLHIIVSILELADEDATTLYKEYLP